MSTGLADLSAALRNNTVSRRPGCVDIAVAASLQVVGKSREGGSLAEQSQRFVKARPVSLKAHAQYNEKWLQREIAEDPSLLGLGDLTVKDVERRQPRAGRLDLLLTDPEAATRYEVEIQLGATDESHIIRTIEYWDIEKSRLWKVHLGGCQTVVLTRLRRKAGAASD
jgi:hypothetical protein